MNYQFKLDPKSDWGNCTEYRYNQLKDSNITVALRESENGIDWTETKDTLVDWDSFILGCELVTEPKPKSKIRYVKLLVFILVAVLLFLLCSCSGNYNPYWSKTKNTAGNGKLNYYTAGWPYQQGCTGIYPKNPTKSSTMKRYHYWRKAKHN